MQVSPIVWLRNRDNLFYLFLAGWLNARIKYRTCIVHALKIVVPTRNIVGRWWIGIWWILVKVRSICSILDSWHYWRLQSPGPQTFPIKTIEPPAKNSMHNVTFIYFQNENNERYLLMFLYLTDATFLVTKTLRWIIPKKKI